MRLLRRTVGLETEKRRRLTTVGSGKASSGSSRRCLNWSSSSASSAALPSIASSPRRANRFIDFSHELLIKDFFYFRFVGSFLW
jgi:hypothetical protein